MYIEGLSHTAKQMPTSSVSRKVYVDICLTRSWSRSLITCGVHLMISLHPLTTLLLTIRWRAVVKAGVILHSTLAVCAVTGAGVTMHSSVWLHGTVTMAAGIRMHVTEHYLSRNTLGFHRRTTSLMLSAGLGKRTIWAAAALMGTVDLRPSISHLRHLLLLFLLLTSSVLAWAWPAHVAVISLCSQRQAPTLLLSSNAWLHNSLLTEV